MKILLILFITLSFVFVTSGRAQDRKSPAETAEDLRTQLSEVQAKEAELQARVKQLEEDLKPENIERYFAGVGSTRPEDLRALRKSQLEREKTTVQRQLEMLAQRRTRLETAILKADSAAYHQSAQGSSSGQQGGQAATAGDQQIAQGPSTTEPLLAAQTTAIPRWLIPLALVIAMVSVGLLIVVIRRVRRA